MTEQYCFGSFTLDRVAGRLFADGVPVPLGATDSRLLLALLENAGTILTKDQLASIVWGRALVSDNVLYVHISALRKALGDDYIENHQRRGYRFAAQVERREIDASHPLAKRSSGNLPSLWANDSNEGPTRLIGRSEQLRMVSERLAHGRLVTLAGPGGVGKTRLALQAGSKVSSQFVDGVWLVELAPLNDEDLVPGAIASALGIKIGMNAGPSDTVSRHLARKSMLIVLDNCEHLTAACAQISEALLAAAPGVKILATSREALSCSGEQVLEVPPLAVPHEAAMSAAAMRGTAAIELLIERAMAADANCRIADEDLAIAARVCRRVDGLPLAIEMVASWVGALGLENLDAKLDGSLKAWLRAKSTAPPRHATLHATLEWSHALLSPMEQTVLRRLAVFAGSFTLEAAEALVSDDTLSKERVFEHVANLVRKSMIAVAPGARTRRYRLLETTRAFMLEKLKESGEADAVRRRHAHEVLIALEHASGELETTSDAGWLERYGLLLDDVRTALDWAMGENSDDAVALAGASWPLWGQLSLRREGRQRLSAAIARLRPDTTPALEARLRAGFGEMLLNTAALHEAGDELGRAAALYRTIGDSPQLGSALTCLGYVLFVLNRMEEAQHAIEEAMALLEPAGWLRTLAIAYSNRLCIDATLGRVDRARIAEEKAARLCEAIGAERISLCVSANLVQVALESGDIDGAIAKGRDVAARARDTPHIHGFALGVLTAALTARGDVEEALRTAREAAPILRDEAALYWLFDHLALRAALVGRGRDAALILGYTEAAHQKLGCQRQSMGRVAIERLHGLLCETLPDAEITELCEMGAKLSEDQATAIALCA